MSHIVTANKKVVSKTPRTDRQHILNFGPNLYVKIGFARKLERQLAGANKRIKELELKEEELNDIKKWLEVR